MSGRASRQHGIGGRFRALCTAGAVAVVLAGCVTEHPAARVAASCRDVAGVIETFSPGDTQPTTDGVLEEPLAALARGLDAEEDRDVRSATERLVEVEAATASGPGEIVDGPDGGAWSEDLAVIDAWAVEHCGFDVQTVVLDVLAAPEGPEPPPRAAPSVGVDGMLDWVDVLEQVRALPPELDWTDRGYVGSVGTDPGITVIVGEAGSEDEALLVCDDVVTALRDDAGDEPLSVHVTTRSGTPLAAGSGGSACAPA